MNAPTQAESDAIVIDLDQTFDARTHFAQGERFQVTAYQEMTDILRRINKILEGLKDVPAQPPRLDCSGKALADHSCHLERINQTIFVEGSRGAGKTTFLLNIENYIRHGATSANSDCTSLAQAFRFLRPIDLTLAGTRKPDQTSFLNTIVALLINEYQDSLEYFPKTSRHHTQSCEEGQTKIYDLVEKISRSMHGYFPGEALYGMEKLSAQQSHLMLEKHLHEFFRILCCHFNCKAMVLMIDDTDMAMHYSFDLLEVVRCFLASPNIITVITGQQTLYDLVIRHHFHKELPAKDISYSDEHFQRKQDIKTIDQAAASYFEKIFPRRNRVHLTSIIHIIRNRPILVKTQKGTIPLRLLQELSKKVLYPGLAMRHTEDLFNSEHENITAREVLQRLGFLYKYVNQAIESFQAIKKNPSEHVQEWFGLESTKRLEGELGKIEKEIPPQDLYFEYVPILVQSLTLQFLKSIGEKSEADNHIDLLQRCNHHRIFQHLDLNAHDPDCNTYLKRDLAALHNRRISSLKIFEESWKRLTTKPSQNRVDPVDLNDEVEIIAGERAIDGINEEDIALLITLFFQRKHNKAKRRATPYFMVRPFIKLLLLGMDNIAVRSDIVECIDIDVAGTDSWTSICSENALSKDINHQCIAGKINGWRKEYKLEQRWIGSRQMDIIIEYFFQNAINIGSDIQRYPAHEVNIYDCFSAIAYAFLNAVAWSEKENFNDGPLSKLLVRYIDIRDKKPLDSEPCRSNVSPLIDSTYPSLMRIFSNHPIILQIIACSKSGKALPLKDALEFAKEWFQSLQELATSTVPGISSNPDFEGLVVQLEKKQLSVQEVAFIADELKKSKDQLLVAMRDDQINRLEEVLKVPRNSLMPQANA
ncbi:MAG: hypothetical protein HQM04_02560 [Magnetococcales bacterium]|nr:hypothetical protein [Magnetococcales bacterium]MBF0113903.1 hypothetical protein [Magnetococcales bacterium]